MYPAYISFPQLSLFGKEFPSVGGASRGYWLRALLRRKQEYPYC